MSGALLAVFLIVAAVVVIGLGFAYATTRAEGRPDRELSYARLLLMQVLVQDDLMPQLPSELREDIKRFVNRPHKELTR